MRIAPASGRHRRKARHELGDHQRSRPETREHRLGLAHAAIGRQRDLAQHAQHAPAQGTADLIPDRVGNQAGGDRGAEQRDHVELPARRQRARQHQQRVGRQRRAELLDEHTGEHEQQPVFGDQTKQQVQGRLGYFSTKARSIT
jgi:hypothetical protein